MNTLLTALQPFAESLHVRSPSEFSVFGRTFGAAAAAVAAPAGVAVDAVNPPGNGVGLLDKRTHAQLVMLLYSGCHGRLPVHLRDTNQPDRDRSLEREFGTRLSIANNGRGPMQSGFVVRAIDADGRLIVRRASFDLWATSAEVEPDTDDRANPTVAAAVEPGMRVRVRFPKEYRAYSPGHYVALGDADRGMHQDPVRIYWNLKSDGAQPLMESICRTFNAAGVGFVLKVLVNPAGYTRADAGILYLPRSDFNAGLAIVRAVYDDIRAFLRAPVSAFVLPLAPGLGLAEDPNDGSSFGLQRSGLLATLLCQAVGSADPLAFVASRLNKMGYDPDRFWLNPGSTHRYAPFSFDAR